MALASNESYKYTGDTHVTTTHIIQRHHWLFVKVIS